MNPISVTFADDTSTLTFDNPEAVTFKVNAEARTIKGIAVPFGVVGNNGYANWQFGPGSLRWGKVKLLNAHDWAQVLGVVDLEESADGLLMTARVAKTTLGDEVLALAEIGAIDGLSIGLGNAIDYDDRDGVLHVISGEVREVSTTPIPAFESASITSVAASAAQKGSPMKCDKCGLMHAAGVIECQTTPPSFTAEAGANLAKKVEDLTEKVEGIKIPVGTATFEVKEPPIYRFDGVLASSGFDFSTDLISAVCEGDRAATQRVLDFANGSVLNPTAPVFVDSSDTAAVNPATYRPDLFKDEGPPLPSPLYDTFYAGAVNDNTPFFYSKLGTYSLGTATHVEGVEPTEGSFNTVTGATITPGLRSGRFGLSREVIDQGGNPQVSGMIWNKVQRTHRLELENVAAAALKSKVADYGTLATPTTGDDGATLGKALKAGLVDLRYTADGQRFTKFFAAKDLYSQLSAAEDDMGRPLFPILSPSNADGTTTAGLGSINVAGIKIDPTWSTSPDDESFYADPQAVKVWNSGLSRLDRVKETAAGYFVDFWFYAASHVYDESGVLKVTYAKA